MKRYTELTKEEKTALSNDGFYTAVKLEAIQRGISPPISLPEALSKLEVRGYRIPPEAATFYEITAAGEYSQKETGIAFATAEEAQRACIGAFLLDRGYGHAPRLSKSDFAVRQTLITLIPEANFATKLETYCPESKDFDKVCEECRTDWQSVLQTDYDTRVNAEKRAQYLTLAQGNEDIAKAFWAKAERSEWGADPVSQVKASAPKPAPDPVDIEF